MATLTSKKCPENADTRPIKTLIALDNISIDYDFDGLEELLDAAELNRNMLAHSVWLKGEKNGPLRIQVTKGNWPKQPHKPKVSKRVNPEGREMGDEYSVYLYAVVEAAVRATIPLWQAVCGMTERNAECSQQPPAHDPNLDRNRVGR